MQTDNNSCSNMGGGVLHWVNSAKGMGVVLVVLGHLLFDSSFSVGNKFVYSFHMPLFFIISGYVQRDINDRKLFMKRRFKRLLVPFLCFTMIGLPIFGWLMLRKGATVAIIIKDTLYVEGTISNNPLWYLAVLFEISIIVAILNLPQKPFNLQLIIFAISILGGWIVYDYSSAFLCLNTFGVNRAIVCFCFYSFGLLIRKLNIKRTWLISVTILSLITCILFGTIFNSKVSIYSFELGNFAFFLLAALSGSIAIMSFCRLCLNKENFLTKLSKYAILFLGTQYFLILPFRNIIRILAINNSMLYDLLMISVTCAILYIMPRVYESVKKKLEMVKLFNGEV